MVYWMYIFQQRRKLAQQEAEQQKRINEENTTLFKNTTVELQRYLTAMKSSIDKIKQLNKNTNEQRDLPLVSTQKKSQETSLVIDKNHLPLILFIGNLPLSIESTIRNLALDFRLIIIGDEKKALNQLLEIPLDIVILFLPKNKTTGLYQKVKKHIPRVPIIVLLENAQQYLIFFQNSKYKPNAYLTIPFKKQELLSCIEHLIHQKNTLKTFCLPKENSLESKASMLSSISTHTQKTENDFLEKVKKLMESQISNSDFSIAFLSKSVGLSHTQLNRKLVALTGQPPVKLMRSIRLNKAKELLTSTSLTISEIAYQTGFSDPSYFSKTFKSETGLSPKKYRQKMI